MAFLNISKTQNKNIVRKVDQENYMKLGKPTSRLDLFDFAVALGVRQGSADIDTPLANKESFVRDEYIGNERYMLASLYFVDHVLTHPEDLDNVIDDSITFQVAEKYAEDGFTILNDYMKQLGPLPFAYKLIDEMDSKFDKILKELPKEHIGYEFDSEIGLMAADGSKTGDKNL